jgi:hypothetical protein
VIKVTKVNTKCQIDVSNLGRRPAEGGQTFVPFESEMRNDYFGFALRIHFTALAGESP